MAYNLPRKEGEPEDLEGILMADALRTCRTAADFEAYLRANLGRNLGARTNLGVIDAEGTAVIFEIHNHGYERLDAAAAPEGYLVNTNSSRTGREAKGSGYVRSDRATELLKSYTSAAVVIVGRKPGDPRSRATMWVLPGEPIMAVALPLWVEAGRSPEPLWKGEEAPLWVKTLRVKKIARPFPEAEREEYLNARRLDNRNGTGFLPRLLSAEDEVFARTAAFLKPPRSPEELGAFQDEAAAAALRALRSIQP